MTPWRSTRKPTPTRRNVTIETFQAAIRSGRLSTEPEKGAGLEFLL